MFHSLAKHSLMAALTLLPAFVTLAENYTVKSPDGSIELTISTDNNLSYQVNVDNKNVIKPSDISMLFANKTRFGINPSVKKSTRTSVDETLTPVLKLRTAQVKNNYNQLTLDFKKGYSVTFRAFDEGVAYRFEGAIQGQATLASEEANFNFVDGTFAYFPFEKNFKTATQPQFIPVQAKSIDEDELGSLPALFIANGINILLTETDLQNYPGLWLRGHSDGRIFGVHPNDLNNGDEFKGTEKFTKTLGIVSTDRTYPWRIMAIARTDAELFNNQMSFTLAEPSRIEDTSWIEPGQIAWDWYNENNFKGVDFVAGINTETYKYYADFAAKFNIENILIDDGWSAQDDVLTVLPGIDVQAIVKYAHSKGVNVQLWVPYYGLDKDLEAAFKLYSEWGINGVKIDFMNSDSIKRVNFYWRTAAMAAKYKIMVNFHGSYKPAGIHRTYPNVMTREGVRGLENNKWAKVTSTHNLHLPFIRMIAGPMDYTPGAMRNAQEKNHTIVWSRPVSLTTRAHQVAIYMLYESPLQMLADTPRSYEAEPEIPTFISAIPTVWDDYKVLSASIGEHLTMARRNGDNWYIGAITNTQKRTVTFDLDFLSSGEYTMVIIEDGINAERFAEDYKQITKTVRKGDTITIDMAKNGGWAAQLIKK
jgi:alpha-glucosidase